MEASKTITKWKQICEINSHKSFATNIKTDIKLQFEDVG
jgi:hypothetical protein